MLVIIVVTSSCDWMSRRAQHRGTPVVVDDTVLRYPDGSSLMLGVGEITLVGQLATGTAAPFVIVAAQGCASCEAPDAVLIRAPSDGPVTEGDPRGVHPHPGRAFSARDGMVRSYSRLFWGECLPQRPPGVISFRSEFGWTGDEPLREVRITEVHGDSLIDWRAIAEVRVLAAALQQVRARRCSELPAREMVGSP